MTAQRLLTEEGIPSYLRGLGLAREGEPIALEGAGDGNINWVRRVEVSGGRPRSFVLKQARPALERFPQYAAPTERLLFEARWFELARAHDMHGICPHVLALDEANRVLVLEDLSACERLDAALARGRDVTAPMESLARFLARVHAATAGDATLPARFDNAAMRALHGEHIFVLPFGESDFGLSPRLRAAAQEVRADAALVGAAAAAHADYEAPRGALVHADVQAGNVLLTPSGGAKLLDLALMALHHNLARLPGDELQRGHIPHRGPVAGVHLHGLAQEADGLGGGLDGEQGIDAVVDLARLFQRGELGDLRDEGLIVDGLEGILEGQLRHQDFQEVLLTDCRHLQVRVPRVRLHHGAVRQVDPDFAGSLNGFTLLFEALILMLAQQMPFRAVGRIVGESEYRVLAVCRRYVHIAGGLAAAGVFCFGTRQVNVTLYSPAGRPVAIAVHVLP